ncbi:hypothetical protein DPEC_G00063520 [Dallia pectoralis]|uniref:Uncharacterized protein n=1 Tax=Dallia pectoralis TaxID=75939 RepID=A0ACC2H7F5_DALPE|nr:hypothetical protein DPEC_G00063520 [Dallia pectoralis]
MILSKKNSDPLQITTAALSSRNTFYFAGYSKEQIESCEMSGVNVDKTTPVIKDDSPKGSDRPVPTSVVCKDEQPFSNATDTNYPNYTKMNFTSLVVYGLRILFAKAVAFNVLFTVKALVF